MTPDIWDFPPEMQAEYEAWLAEREASGCVCLTCIMARKRRMRNVLAKQEQPDV